MESLNFFINFIKNPSAVGAIIPSSKALALQIIETTKVREANVIVEFGAGTGVITQQIQLARKPDSHFFSFEINEELARITKERCPDVEILIESAAKTMDILSKNNLDSCDCIVSGLPWATLPQDIQKELFSVILQALRPGGIFATFGYVQSSIMPSVTRFRDKLEQSFSETGTTRYVWGNVPPARVYWAKK